MFEKKLKEISKELGEEEYSTYYILTHKKHRREVYFQNNKEAITFIKNRFNSPLRQLIFFMIELRVLQLFLRKIKLSSKLGEVILIANQVKSFDLKNKIVTSFIRKEENRYKKKFIDLKEFQKKIAKEKFAPEIFEINKIFPFSREELLSNYKGRENKKIFKKLIRYYEVNKIDTISLGNYLNYLEKKLNNKNLLLEKVLSNIKKRYSEDISIKFVKAHGSFTKEQILIKNKEIIFTDWENKKRLITIDFINFFRKEKRLLRNRKFKELLKIYPEDVQKNIKLYVLLSEIDALLRKERNEVSKYRIEEILGKI